MEVARPPHGASLLLAWPAASSGSSPRRAGARQKQGEWPHAWYTAATLNHTALRTHRAPDVLAEQKEHGLWSGKA